MLAFNPLDLLSLWGYYIIFLGALFETTPLFGLVVPGQSLVILGGVLAKAGTLKLIYVILAATGGAIIGDLIGYFLGRKYGHDFIVKYGKRVGFKEEYYNKVKRLMKDHTGKTLIIGRFNSVTRAFAPFVAGASEVSFTKMLMYDIIGGALWGGVMVCLGYLFGQSFEVAAKVAGRYVVGAIVLVIALIFAFRFIQKRKHLFVRYHIVALVTCLTTILVFGVIMEDVMDHEDTSALDVYVASHMPSLRTPWLTEILTFLTNLFNPLFLLLITLILGFIFAWQRRYGVLILLGVSLLGGLIIQLVVKFIAHRPRPANPLIEVTGYSFPSGHALMSVIFFSLLIYAFKDDIKSILIKWIFILVNVLLFLAVGFSRVYLNVHFFTDVIAGFAIGIFWLTLVILALGIVNDHLKQKHKRIRDQEDW